MTRTCNHCGRSFPTLTKYRIHQRDGCPASEEIPVDGDVDDLVERAVEELAKCENCGVSTEGFDQVLSDDAAGVSVEVTFTCDECGFHNDNTAVLK